MRNTHVVAVAILTVLVMGLSVPVLADYTLLAFDVVAPYESVSIALDTSAVPAGSYAAYSVTITWDTDAAWSSFSDEAVWELVQPDSPYLLASPGPSPDGDDEIDPMTLTWSGSLTETYQGGDPLVFRAAQTLRNTSASWTDVSITLYSGTVAPPALPAAIDLGDVQSGWASAYVSLDSNGVAWFKFTTPDVTTAGCEVLRIDTIGSTLSGGVYRSGDDTEIAVYNSAGQLVATGDDVDMLSEQLHAALGFGANEGKPVASSGDLQAGEYYVAVAGFDAAFGVGFFEVTPNSAVEGTLRINTTFGEVLFDCNENGIADVCDVTNGSSVDVNTNGVPDECEDCNGNGILDTDEIAAGALEDCDSNGVPDACDVVRFDCNFNGQVDACEVSAGSSEDCNRNSVPDECDISSGNSGDCNANAIPDECDFGHARLYGLSSSESGSWGASLGVLLPSSDMYWLGYLGEQNPQALGLAVRPEPGGEFYAVVASCSDLSQCMTRLLVRLEPANILIPTTEVGEIYEDVVDIAFHPNGTLYGVIGDLGIVPGEIVVIDTETGTVGHPGIFGGGGGGYWGNTRGHGIAFHPRTGLMYHTYCADSVCSIETITVENWAVQPLKVGIAGMYLALAFDESADLLVGWGAFPDDHPLYSSKWIDPGTGDEIGDAGFGWDVGGLAFSVSAMDCNSNSIPDVCDAAGGLAADFDADGLLDLCDGDLDNDGLVNGVDVCDYSPPGDPVTLLGGSQGAWTDDCIVDILDYPFYAACLETGGPAMEPGADCLSVFDISGDGHVDLADFAAFQNAFGGFGE